MTLDLLQGHLTEKTVTLGLPQGHQSEKTVTSAVRSGMLIEKTVLNPNNHHHNVILSCTRRFLKILHLHTILYTDLKPIVFQIYTYWRRY